MSVINHKKHNDENHNGESKPLVFVYWCQDGTNFGHCKDCNTRITTQVYNCPECKWDICLTCAKVRHHHPLFMRENIPSSPYTCSSCTTQISLADKEYYLCLTCEYYLCSRCYVLKEEVPAFPKRWTTIDTLNKPPPVELKGMEEVPKSILDDLKATFHKMDKDKSGLLSVKELSDNLKPFGVTATAEELTNIVKDLDGTKDIKFQSYLDLMTLGIRTYGATEATKREMQAAFQLVAGEDGNITPSKFKQIMHFLGEDLTDEEVDILFLEAKPNNGDGKLDFDDFVRMFSS